MADETTQQNGNVINLRLANLETDRDRLEADVKVLREELSAMRENIARLSERLTLFQLFQASLSSILSGVAVAISKLP